MGINADYWKETLDMVEEDLRAIEVLMKKYTKPEDGYVICNDTYCDVGAGKGLNGTSISMWSVDAQVFKTKADAEANTDRWLVNGNNEPICLEQVPACEYFDDLRELRLSTKDILERSNRRIHKKICAMSARP